MSRDERCLTFDCEGDRLQGIAHLPADPATASGVGVVIVVGGPQYRAGSHRQFVLLARALADAGHGVLRFDVRGMGDSEGEPRSFETIDGDIGAAIRAARSIMPGLRKLVLWGLCDGASAALLYVQARGDGHGLDGLCLVNPWVRTPATQARTQLRHYYLGRLASRDFWSKLFRGKVAADAARSLLANAIASWRPESPQECQVPLATFIQRMAAGFVAFQGEVLLVLSGQDLTAQEFRLSWEGGAAWRRARQSASVVRLNMTDADHTFSEGAQRLQLECEVATWLRRLGGVDPGGSAVPTASSMPIDAKDPSMPIRLQRLRPAILSGCTALTLMAGPALAAESPVAATAPQGCGPLTNAFGPYDYRSDKFRTVPGDPMGYEQKRNLVEGAHFTPEVEALIRGKSTFLPGGDIDYTLRAWPNNHRALLAMQRYGAKLKIDPPTGSHYTVECWYLRAITFAPDDAVARMLFAGFLDSKGRRKEALGQLRAVSRLAADDAFTHFNLGLSYLALQDYDDALEHAHRAMALGFPRTELKDQLVRLGKWSDPAPAPTKSTPEKSP